MELLYTKIRHFRLRKKGEFSIADHLFPDSIQHLIFQEAGTVYLITPGDFSGVTSQNI
jgi:hypothetical protein